MPAPKSLAAYPEWFFTICERAMSSGYSERVRVQSRGAGINLRQRFYKFRQLLVEAGHPHSSGALSLTLTLDPAGAECDLVFSQIAGISDEAARQLGIKSEERPQLAPIAPASDRAEELMQQLLASNSPQSKPQCPPHEEDATGVMCLHCGKPRDEWESS